MHLSGSWAPQVCRKRGQGLALLIPCMGKQKSAFRASAPSSAKARLVSSPSNLASPCSNLASPRSNLAWEICWFANAEKWIIDDYSRFSPKNPVVIMHPMINIVLQVQYCPVAINSPEIGGSSWLREKQQWLTFNQSRVACHLSRIRSIMVWKPSWLPVNCEHRLDCHVLRVMAGTIPGCCNVWNLDQFWVQREDIFQDVAPPSREQPKESNDFAKNYSAGPWWGVKNSAWGLSVFWVSFPSVIIDGKFSESDSKPHLCPECVLCQKRGSNSTKSDFKWQFRSIAFFRTRLSLCQVTLHCLKKDLKVLGMFGCLAHSVTVCSAVGWFGAWPNLCQVGASTVFNTF